eukprot:415704-Pleurochrysis_carterae.AAC.1
MRPRNEACSRCVAMRNWRSRSANSSITYDDTYSCADLESSSVRAWLRAGCAHACAWAWAWACSCTCACACACVCVLRACACVSVRLRGHGRGHGRGRVGVCVRAYACTYV